jgi:hypothetical protein
MAVLSHMVKRGEIVNSRTAHLTAHPEVVEESEVLNPVGDVPILLVNDQVNKVFILFQI